MLIYGILPGGLVVPNLNLTTYATTFPEEMVIRYDILQKVHCDQAPVFQGKVISDLISCLNVNKTRTTPYRTISKGLIERSNQTIQSIMK